MYGIAIEYARGDATASPDPLERTDCCAVFVRQPGYRRRLALVADGGYRMVDLFLFDGPDAARAALASDGWRALAAAHPACRSAAPALLVSESPWGDLVVLLRGAVGPTRGGQACWRDHLAHAAPEAVLW